MLPDRLQKQLKLEEVNISDEGGNRWKGESAWPALVLHPLGTIPSLLYLTLTTHNPWGHLTLTTHNPWGHLTLTTHNPCMTQRLTNTPLSTLFPLPSLIQDFLPTLPARPLLSTFKYSPRISALRILVCSPGQGTLPLPGCLHALLLGIWPEYSLILASFLHPEKTLGQKLYLCVPRNSTRIGLSRGQRGYEKQMCQPWTVEKKIIVAFGFNLGKEGASQGVLMVKNAPAHAGDTGLIPELGRSPGGRNRYPLQCSCLGESHRQRSQAGYSPWGQKSGTRLSLWALGKKT